MLKTSSSSQTILSLAKAFLERSASGETWRQIAFQYRITPAMAYRIAHDQYDPKSPATRLRLGLPALAPAPVCAKCGVVHLAKRCTHRSTPPAWVLQAAGNLRELRERKLDHENP